MQTLQIQVGRVLFQFDEFRDWVNNARRKFERCGVPSQRTVCIDTAGRILRTGREFQRARDEGAFPVNVYAIDPANEWPWECPGHGRGGTKAACCSRAGEYNGFDSGPLTFTCPKHCSCHD